MKPPICDVNTAIDIEDDDDDDDPVEIIGSNRPQAKGESKTASKDHTKNQTSSWGQQT